MNKILAVAAIVAMMAAPARAATILQFSEIGPFNTPFVFTGNGTTTTLTASKAVDVVFDPAFCLVAGCGGVTGGAYDLELTATSIGAAILSGGAVTQQFGGELSLTNGTVDLLTVMFTDLVQGSLDGSSPTLQASQPPDTFSGSSTVFDPTKLGIPRGFALSFSNMTNGGLGISGTSIRSGAADGTGTFSATPIPEPATLMLFGTGLLGLLPMLRRRRA
jgi:hypothetical protein